MGSVKDLVVLKKPAAFETGIANFMFSDRYSVFDWGEMPNHFANKGKALCLVGAYFFEKLEEMGVKTHYLGLVENGQVKRLRQLQEPVNAMQVKLVQVIKPKLREGAYDYSIYDSGTSNFLVPLEIIYRNALPEGSSVFQRLNNGTLQLAEIGLAEMPAPGQRLEKPILDVSTKLEATDRYLSWDEARKIAGINDQETGLIRQTTLQINDLITREAQKMDLVHEDGKVEYGINEDAQLMVVDVLGTPDECRFTFQGIPVSKEAARIYYRTTSWYKEVEAAKKQNNVQWKKLVSSPPPLPEKLDNLISQLYMAFCNELTGREWFGTSSLKDVLAELQEVLPSRESARR
ncbi:MAG: phosphoribosylaminoimidazolesuccinocarboxamide synthase [bacterium]